MQILKKSFALIPDVQCSTITTQAHTPHTHTNTCKKVVLIYCIIIENKKSQFLISRLHKGTDPVPTYAAEFNTQGLMIQHNMVASGTQFKGAHQRFMFFIQHCFICRPSDSSMSEDAGIEPMTVTTLTLAVRRSHHSARSHPHNYILSRQVTWGRRKKFIILFFYFEALSTLVLAHAQCKNERSIFSRLGTFKESSKVLCASLY